MGVKTKGKAILVVGGAGYIGSHMVKLLQEREVPVVVLDNFSTGYHRLVDGVELVEGSLGDAGLLDKVFGTYDIEAVMHFAAYSLVGESVHAPLKYYRNNLAETVSLIEAMIRNGVQKFIFSSTAAVYGEPQHIPIREDHPCSPTNPYGDTKLAVERMLRHCERSHGLKSVSLRYFNAAGAHPSGTIGEMHNPESHLIPLVLKAALEGTPVNIYGSDYSTEDGTCIRDYIHVCDLASAHLLALRLLQRGGASDCFNLGNNVGYSVRQVIEIAESVTGRTIETVACDRRPGDPAVLVADSYKARRLLEWKPECENLETIIESAWRWHSHLWDEP